MAEEKLVLPVDHFKKRAIAQYSDIHLTIIREVLQNSQDAGAKNVWFNVEDGKWSAKDDGCGMNLDEFRKNYITLGGTKKPLAAIGGFGAAKEILSFFADGWYCKGHDFLATGNGCANIQSIPLPYNQAGFELGATDPYYNAGKFGTAARLVVKRSHLNCKVFLNGVEIPDGRHLRSNQILWDFGEGNVLYVVKSNIDYDKYRESIGYKFIRTGGLFTASEWTGGDYLFYFEVQNSHVLTENRESLRNDVKERIGKEISALLNSGKIEKKPTVKRLTLYGIPAQAYQPAGRYGASPLASTPAMEKVALKVIENEYEESFPVEEKVVPAPRAEVVYNEAPPKDEPVIENEPEEIEEDEAEEVAPVIEDVKLSDVKDVKEVYNSTTGTLEFAHKLKIADYPFAIFEDGVKEKGVLDENGGLTPPAQKALRLMAAVYKLLAVDLEIKTPIPAFLFSNEAEGINQKVGPYQVVGIPLHTLLGKHKEYDSPMGLLEIFMHEFAHNWYDGHNTDFELKRMWIARTVGRKINVYLNVIEGLQNA